jgi:hypothetical protein
VTTIPLGREAELHAAGASRDDEGHDRDGADCYCPGCGYDLRGLAHDRCPECGRVARRGDRCGVRLPWTQRARLGTAEAFWRTAALVTFRPDEFAARFHWQHVRHHGSAGFRRRTVACAAAASVLAAAGFAWHARLSAHATSVLLGALLPSALAFFYAATELAGFFAGPRPPSDTSEEGFRAAIVNDYASAALAWTPLPALLACAGAAAARADLSPGPAAADYLFSLALLCCAAIAVLWLADVLAVFGRALSIGPAGLFLAAVVFPLRFAGLAVLTAVFVFLPLACCVGGLISLRP